MQQFLNKKKNFLIEDGRALQDSLEFIEETLKEIGLKDKLILRTLLLAEELIPQLIRHAADGAKLRVRVRRYLGDIGVSIRAAGECFDPYTAPGDDSVGIGEMGEEEAEQAIRGILLRSQGDKLKISHRNGVNRIRILAGRASQQMVLYTTVALLMGLLCGLLMKFVLPAAFSDGLETYLLDPITTMLSRLIPLVVFCSVAVMIEDMGRASLVSIFGYAGVYLIALFGMMLIYGLMVLILGRLNPFIFFKKNREGMLTSFTLSSSSAAMPTNMRICTDLLGISPKVCNFSIPLGATVNMDGTCIFLTITGLFLARAYGVTIPESAMVSLAITIILLSLGCPGIPGASIVCLCVVLANLGVPIEAIGLIMGINPFLQMANTMSNTTGDIAASLIVARSERLLDLDIYNSR